MVHACQRYIKRQLNQATDETSLSLSLGEEKMAELNQANSRRGHVVMFPFMAQGHLIPFVALAKLLEARSSFTITLVNTPLNIRSLRSALPPTTTIRLAELPFSGTDHGLPPNAENVDTIDYYLITRLFQASESLETSFERLLSDISAQEGQPPLCIISDVLLAWTTTVADKHGIFHTVFNTSGVYGLAVCFSLWLHLPHCYTDSEEFQLPDFPGVRLHISQLSKLLKVADSKDTGIKFLRRQISFCLNSGGMLCNSVEEMEKKGVQQLRRKMMGRPVWTIGPLLPPFLLDSSSPYKLEARAGKEPGITEESCVKWLDQHPPGSVLYISFGSQNTISNSQMMQLAMGLEACGKAFIWTVRPPLGVPLEEELKPEWLPEEFEERLKGVGLLVRKWAPQLAILSHRSTAAFLSHCGWNSVLESLIQGVPMIGWPISAEQFYNSKLLEEELGVCVELVRGNGSQVGCDHVEKIVRLVMDGGEKTEDMKRRAGRVRETMRAAIREEGDCRGSSIEGLDSFIETAVSTVRQNGRSVSHQL